MRYVGIGIVCILIGLGIANRIVDRLNGEKIKKVIYIVIGVSGILNVIG